MTPEQFLMALRRFIVRRGKPEVIISDNAPQFKVADTALEKAWQKILRDAEVQSYVSEQGITWLFIKELSPWMGGFYERLIGITKMALKKSIGGFSLTSIQLQTTLSEIEAIVNPRPLIYLEDDVNNPIITPQHFLSINTNSGSSAIGGMDERDDPDYLHQKMDSSTELLETWKKGNRYLDQFLDVWKSHYLTSLRERSHIFNKHARIRSAQEPNIGDVVQIKDTTSRGTWKLGWIIKLVSSQDGLIRAAKIILPNKTVLQRFIVHLFPLECNGDTRKTKEEQTCQEHDHKANEKYSGCKISRQSRKAAEEAGERTLAQQLDTETPLVGVS